MRAPTTQELRDPEASIRGRRAVMTVEGDPLEWPVMIARLTCAIWHSNGGHPPELNQRLWANFGRFHETRKPEEPTSDKEGPEQVPPLLPSWYRFGNTLPESEFPRDLGNGVYEIELV